MLDPLKRQQIFIDRAVQGELVLRTILYWTACLLAMTFTIVIWSLWAQQEQPLATVWDQLTSQLGPALMAAVMLLPVVIVDSIRLSNRFAGPLYRCRAAMRRLSAGETIERIEFRHDDFWREFAEDLNRLNEELQQLRESAHNLSDELETASESCVVS